MGLITMKKNTIEGRICSVIFPNSKKVKSRSRLVVSLEFLFTSISILHCQLGVKQNFILHILPPATLKEYETMVMKFWWNK